MSLRLASGMANSARNSAKLPLARISPLCNITNESHIFSAESSTCVLIRIDLPFAFSSSKSSIKSAMATGSSPKNGSSTIKRLGSTTNAQIIMTFCFIPLEKCTGNQSNFSFKRNIVNNFSTRAKATFCSTS